MTVSNWKNFLLPIIKKMIYTGYINNSHYLLQWQNN